MGQAKRRGTFEQRLALALANKPPGTGEQTVDPLFSNPEHKSKRAKYSNSPELVTFAALVQGVK